MIRKIYNNLEEITGSVLLIAMCVIATLQVASRYIFREPFSWTQEVCTFMFVWLTFIGASLALKTGDHFAVDIIAEKLPGRIGLAVKLISCLLVTTFAVLMVWFGWRLLLIGRHSVTPAMEIPNAIPYSAIFFGGILMLIRSVELLIKLFTKRKIAALS